jgi:hypothetical protein
MEMFQGIFDQGFSGILEESSRKTMPDYIEKLAESEIDYEPSEMSVPNILFENDFGLSRANELTSDITRESNKENRFTLEKIEKTSSENKLKTIDKQVNRMIDQNNNYAKIRSFLLLSYRDSAFLYLQSKIKLILNKYAFLGFNNIEDKQANIVEQSKNELKVRRSTVHDVLNKFSKLDYVSSSVIKEYKDLLSNKRPIDVVAQFLFSLEQIKQAYYQEKEARVAFKRDIDKKDLSIRDVDNNVKKNSLIDQHVVFESMLCEYKQGINSKLSKSEICKKLAKIYGFDKFQQFSEKYKEEIIKSEKFSKRQTFFTGFASSTLQGVEVETKSKPVSIDIKAMTNYAFRLMSNGNTIELVKNSLKKKFGLEASKQFISANEKKLQKYYGQLGYVFIDSNIYPDCSEMAETYSKMQHSGSKLIYSLKSNDKCFGCNLNKQGVCSKVGLLVSNNPIVRSFRAAKRVFNKAAEFVPQTYIDCFAKNIKIEESNLKLISKFALGIDDALNNEKKNIGKQASKDRSTTIDTQESFITPISMDVSSLESASSIIDDILKKG